MGFGESKTLDELESESETMDAKISLAKKRALLKQVTKRHGKGGWKLFSSTGTKSGIDWDKVKFQLDSTGASSRSLREVKDVSGLRGRG